MVLRVAPFFLRELLSPHVLILHVSLREIAGAKTLAGRKIAGPIGVALDVGLEAPLRIGGRTRTAAAEILFVFNFERAKVAFDLVQFFVNAWWHAGTRGGGLMAQVPTIVQRRGCGGRRQTECAERCRKGKWDSGTGGGRR